MCKSQVHQWSRITYDYHCYFNNKLLLRITSPFNTSSTALSNQLSNNSLWFISNFYCTNLSSSFNIFQIILNFIAYYSHLWFICIKCKSLSEGLVSHTASGGKWQPTEVHDTRLRCVSHHIKAQQAQRGENFNIVHILENLIECGMANVLWKSVTLKDIY